MLGMRRTLEALMLHPLTDASSAEGASTRDYHPWMMRFGDSESLEAQRAIQRAGRALGFLLLLSSLFLLLRSLLFRLLTATGTGTGACCCCCNILSDRNRWHVVRRYGHAWLANRSLCVRVTIGHAWRTHCSGGAHPASSVGQLRCSRFASHTDSQLL